LSVFPFERITYNVCTIVMINGINPIPTCNRDLPRIWKYWALGPLGLKMTDHFYQSMGLGKISKHWPK
jgi:hypothetical protein